VKRPLIFRAARHRLAEIWEYTLERWGEEQADRYLQTLAECIGSLDRDRLAWRRLKDKRLAGVFFVRSGHHYIFFREIEGHIAVISVLHENMDILQRLRQDIEEGR